MRPLSMSERIDGQTVSLAELLTGSRPRIAGAASWPSTTMSRRSSPPGCRVIRGLTGRARRLQLDGYLNRIVDREIPDETGTTIRNPAALRRWMAAYAAASSTTTSFEKIRDAASAGHDNPPARITAQMYRDALTQDLDPRRDSGVDSGQQPAQRAWPGPQASAGGSGARRSTARRRRRRTARRRIPRSFDSARRHASRRAVREPGSALDTGLLRTTTRPGSATCARREADKRST